MGDSDEPPVKIKKENESVNIIKEEIIEVSDTEVSTTSLVNHRVRILPSWLQLPNTTSHVKVNPEPKNSASTSKLVQSNSNTTKNSGNNLPIKPIKIETQPNENHVNGPTGSDSSTFLNGDITIPKPIKNEAQCDENSGNSGQIQSTSNTVICSDISMLKPIKIKIEKEEKTENYSANSISNGNLAIPDTIKTETQNDNSNENDQNQCNSDTIPVGGVKAERPSTPDNEASSSLPCSSTNDGTSSSTDTNQKPPCRFGSSCYRMNTEHRRDFHHPPGSDPSKSPQKPRCRYGAQCYRKNEEHRNRFVHPRSPYNFMSNQQRLRNAGSQTYRFSDDSDNDGLEDFSTDGSEDEFHVSAEEDESVTDFEAEDDGFATDFDPED